MKAMKNISHVEGYLYDHKLERKVSNSEKTAGTEYIRGTIDIATDEAGMNVVQIHYTFCTPTTKKNTENRTYTVLDNIMNNGRTWLKDGKDNALKLRWDGAIDVNDFYSDRNGGEPELVTTRRNEGGFLHVVTDALNADEKLRATWDMDVMITNVRSIDENPDKNETAKVIVSGAGFNFRKELVPIELVARNPRAIDYFLGLEASSKQPVVTNLRGRHVAQTITNVVTEESAFGGEPSVTERKSSRKEMLITWAAPDTYEWDSESSITAAEVKEAMAARALHIADAKARYESGAAAISATASNTVASNSDEDYHF